MGYSVRFAGSPALTKERRIERLAGPSRPEKAKEKPAGLRLKERRITPWEKKGSKLSVLLSPAGSQLFVNHSGLFWPPWRPDLTIRKKQRCERFEGATFFLTRTSTS
jgi:hypothetical protein